MKKKKTKNKISAKYSDKFDIDSLDIVKNKITREKKYYNNNTV